MLYVALILVGMLIGGLIEVSISQDSGASAFLAFLGLVVLGLLFVGKTCL